MKTALCIGCAVVVSFSAVVSAAGKGKAAAKPEAAKSTVAQQSDSGKVLLCSDTAADGTKLVYAYIDGKKTDCMREQELKMLLGAHEFQRDTAFKRDQSDGVLGTDVMAELQKGRSVRELDLRGRDLMKVDFSGKDLHRMDLRGTDFRQANLQGADLRGADLRGAFLMSANLKKARLDSANLEGAFLQKADLTGAQGLTLDMLKSTTSLFKTALDSSLQAKAQEQFPDKFKGRNDHWKSKDRPESEGPQAK